MDVNDQLDKIRHAVARAQQFSDLGQTGANYTWQLERAADAFTLLDAYLSGGGAPPEEWREGPDAHDEPVPDFARRLDIARGYYAGVRDATPDPDDAPSRVH